MLSQAPSPRAQEAINRACNEMRTTVSAAAEPYRQKHAALLRAVSILRTDVSRIIASIDPAHPVLQIQDDVDFFEQVAESRPLRPRKLVGAKARVILDALSETGRKAQALQRVLDEFI